LGQIASTSYVGDSIDFRTSPSVAISYAEGLTFYNTAQHSLAYYNDVTNNMVNAGEEIQVKVINNTGSTIAAGAPVYVTSTSSGQTYPNVALAKADNLTTANVLGLAHMSIPNGSVGYVVTIGLITGINTGAFTVGDILYLSPYSAGNFMNTYPPTGYAVPVGVVAYANSNGTIYVNKGTSGVSSFSAGTTGLTPSTATTGAVTLAGTLGTANGGTNNTATPTAGTVAYGDGTKITYTSAGTTGQALISNGSSAPTWGTPAGSLTITNTSSNTDYNLAFTTASSGTITGEYVDNGNLKYNPSTNKFSLKNIYLATDGSNNATLMNTLNTNFNFGVNNQTKMYLDTLGAMHLQMYNAWSPTHYEAYIIFDHITSGAVSGINAYDSADSNNGLIFFYTSHPTRGQATFGIDNYGAIFIGANNTGSFGTSGQVLTSKGSGAAAVWSGIAGGTF
jgi:hypothetical protein